jgi:DNA modification methylase
MTTHRIHVQSCLKMVEPDASIDLIVTSPPYNVGVKYRVCNDVRPYDEYRLFLENVWKECWRVLKPGGHLCIVIGDKLNAKDSDGRACMIPTHAIIEESMFCNGWSCVGQIIWSKMGNVNSSGGGSLLGSYPYPPNPWIPGRYEFILVFRKPGAKVHRELLREEKEQSKLTIDEWKKFVDGIWTVGGIKSGMAKFAAFPEEIPRRLIRMYSFIGDTVLDPFYGTGTTGRVAKGLGRNSIGYEIDSGLKEFWVIEERPE